MLDPAIAELARGANYAVVTTLFADGTPQSLPLWIDVDEAGEHILINTEIHRQRAKNISGDPRVTVCIVESGNWYRWAEVRGHVVSEIRGPEARAHIDALAKKYFGVDEYPRPIESERIIYVIAPDRQIPPMSEG